MTCTLQFTVLTVRKDTNDTERFDDLSIRFKKSYDFNCVPAIANILDSEPEFVNFLGSQEPRARFCKRLRRTGIDSEDPIPPAMQHGGPVRQIGLSYRPVRLGIDSWAP